jgi:hypothetical protein
MDSVQDIEFKAIRPPGVRKLMDELRKRAIQLNEGRVGQGRGRKFMDGLALWGGSST